LAEADGLVSELVATINANRAHLSAIGDGDHGVNMSKGFTRAGAALGDSPPPPQALSTLSDALFEGIGGSMGPLNGSLFSAMAETFDGAETLDGPLCGRMLRAGFDAVRELGSAEPGDKTMLDARSPAANAFDAAQKNGKSFADSLDAMAAAAERGRDATRDMVARVGRASRLGERSRGRGRRRRLVLLPDPADNRDWSEKAAGGAQRRCCQRPGNTESLDARVEVNGGGS
jgi:dihydroxyacetone kinase-like protein